MEKGGHIIIPRGSDNIQWEKVVIPSFHVVHIYNGEKVVIPRGSYTMGKGGHSRWIIYNGEKVVIPSFHVDHIQWEKVVIPRGSYTMGNGGHSIIQSFIYTMEKGGHSIIPCGYNGKRWSFQVEHIQWEKVGHNKWNIHNGKRWVIPSATTIGKDNHFTWIIYTMGKRWSCHHS